MTIQKIRQNATLLARQIERVKQTATGQDWVLLQQAENAMDMAREFLYDVHNQEAS